MTQELRVLIIEDSDDDAEMLRMAVEQTGYTVVSSQVQTAKDMRQALAHDRWDLILSDFSMPNFSAVGALSVLQEVGLDLPFIIVSGTISEEIAVEAMKNGAADFLTKGRLSRLGPAIQRELAEVAGRRERRAVEAALSEVRNRAQFALEAAGVGTWEADMTTGGVTWSPLLEQLHGLSPGTFGGTIDEFFSLIEADERPQVKAAVSRTFQEGSDCHLEYRVRWPDGSTHWIAGYGRAIRNADGLSDRAAGIGLDITNQKQLEEQFHQAQKMEAVGRLAGGIAHDFNNLLTAILGYSELVLERVAHQPDLVDDVQEIRKAGDQARRLTGQLLAFSRKQTIAPRVMNVNDTVVDLEKILRRVIGEDVVLEIALRSQGAVRADPGQVEQVLMNLAVNARDAMPRGGRLTIETSDIDVDASMVRRHADAKPGRYVAIRIEDCGAGISPDVLARMFEPFFTTKAVGKGTGLGLSTVYGIVRQGGGFITVDSAVGVGTSFVVCLPCVEAADAELSALTATPPNLTGRETVLVVEDSVGVRELVRKVLDRYGYRVLVSRDVSDAMSIGEHYAGTIHLLLTDIVMPVLNGPDLAQHLVRRRPEMRVLYMSGFAYHAGAGLRPISARTAFIQKPFSSEALAIKVRECLERQGSVPRATA